MSLSACTKNARLIFFLVSITKKKTPPGCLLFHVLSVFPVGKNTLCIFQEIIGNSYLILCDRFIIFQNRPGIAASGNRSYLIHGKCIAAVLADQFISLLFVIAFPGAVADLTGIKSSSDCPSGIFYRNHFHLHAVYFYRIKLCLFPQGVYRKTEAGASVF